MLWKGAYLIYVLALMLDDTTLNLPSTQAPFELSKRTRHRSKTITKYNYRVHQYTITQVPFELTKKPDMEAKQFPSTITKYTIAIWIVKKRARHRSKTITKYTRAIWIVKKSQTWKQNNYLENNFVCGKLAKAISANLGWGEPK